ncbi:MAG: LacI family DNA-binding transcriptional regulator, partial [Bacteroidales bacterium]|nr:LacI family DNA-binding transcriptional regulator [Bacteroidales bacterium]
MAPTDKITINDIARRTGLSKGTVDRVLHNRGEVSKKSYAKVMDAIHELGYEPNVFASILAKGGSQLVAILIPTYEKGSFWELAASGIDKAAEGTGTIGIRIESFGYDQYDIES